MKILRIVKITLFLIILCTNTGHAFDLDMTIDDDIRKNYNSSKLVNDTKTNTDENLPPLPDKLKNSTNISVPKSVPAGQIVQGNIKIPKGTKFNVINNTKISDYQKKGSSIKFTSLKQIRGKNFVIPANTIFYGEIVSSHQPQFTCNGGLVEIKLLSMAYNNDVYQINAYVTRANDKIIFFNNIKGKRTYFKTMIKKSGSGKKFFKKMLKTTNKLANNNVTLILSPLPFVTGTVVLVSAVAISPVCAIFSKGEHIVIPANSKFTIKLLDDVFVN